jgi:hypothetical protein
MSIDALEMDRRLIALQPNPRQGSADGRRLGTRGEVRRLPRAGHKVGSRVILFSRNGHDFTERVPSVAQLLHELPVNADCSPNSAKLHVRWARPSTIHLGRLTYLHSMV